MCKEWLEHVEIGFFEQHDKYLDDIQREILLRCYDSKQSYEKIATELNYSPRTINLLASQLWKLLSDVFEEKVTKANLRGAIKRFKNRIDSRNIDLNNIDSNNTTTPKSFKIFMSDRSKNSEPSITEQLRKTLQDARQATTIGQDWLQRSNEELNEYDCFLLIVSSHSVDESEIMIEELQRARESRETRPDKPLTILLIHAGSHLSLPLNHPIHQQLQDISQSECLSSSDLPTLVAEIMKCLETTNESTLRGLLLLIQKLGKLKISDNWMLTYVGENQLHKLGDLVLDLKNRKIRSGYAYWGVGPTRMWTTACTDPCYHMRENIERFPDHARQLANYVNKEQYNFVSLGVGEGSKDSNIIRDFFNQDDQAKPRDDFSYLPVDMSLDMLRVAIGRIQELPSHRRIAIQRDIETKEGMAEIAHIAKVLGENKPILYGFIGNTIANVEDPEHVLNNIVQVMKSEDLLLFEAQIIDDSALENSQLQKTIRHVKEEYEGISFRQFALSALLQNSDLSVEPKERDSCYVVEVSLQPWKYGQVLQIGCCFENNTDKELYLTFPNEDTTTLDLKEKIHLYCSRKFTQGTLEHFVQATNLSILGKSVYLSNKGTGFVVMMLQRNYRN
jgi:hypothetical protein